MTDSTPPAWDEDTTWHAPGDGGLFGPMALCGERPGPDGLRLMSIGHQVTCAECRSRLLAGPFG